MWERNHETRNTAPHSFESSWRDLQDLHVFAAFLTPIWKRKALLASVIRAKNTAPEKKPTDHSNAVRSTGSREFWKTIKIANSRRAVSSFFEKRSEIPTFGWQWVPSLKNDQNCKHSAGNEFLLWSPLKNVQNFQHSAGNEFLLNF